MGPLDALGATGALVLVGVLIWLARGQVRAYRDAADIGDELAEGRRERGQEVAERKARWMDRAMNRVSGRRRRSR